MQIRHQLALFIGIPFALQIGTMGWLILSSAKVDELVARETRTKKAMTLALDIRSKLEQAVILIATKSLVGLGMNGTTFHRDLVRRDFLELRQVAATENGIMPLVDQLQARTDHFLELFEEPANAYQPGNDQLFFSQFLGKSEFIESLTLSFDSIKKDTDSLLAKYKPIAEDLGPKALRGREALRTAMVGAIAMNVAVVAGIALLLNKTTLHRLRILTENMKEFSKGKPPSKRLEGNDELSDLDSSFNEMADELARLNEVRKSMQAMVSHDLRSPLTSMALRLEMMVQMQTEQLPPQVEKDLKHLKSETDRLKRLANTLLDIEKMEEGSMQVISKNIACQEIVSTSVEALLSQLKRKQIAVEQSVPQETAFLGDADRTIQVVINFLSNAVKFAPKNSKVTISLVSASETVWRLEVHDEGPGVPVDKRDKLFGKFNQLDQPDEVRKEGSGLGLYICKLLIEAQNGRVGYRPSEQGGGSCFWLELPKGELSPPET